MRTMPRAPQLALSPKTQDRNPQENFSDDGGDAPQKHPLPHRVSFFSRENFLGPVKKDHGDLPLLAMSFVTGMVDAACFRNYDMFVGMQTGTYRPSFLTTSRGSAHDWRRPGRNLTVHCAGNTVILGLSTAGLPENPHAWLTTLVSILAFLVGAYVTFHASKYVTPEGPSRNRLWMALLFLLQGLLLIIAAALATPTGIVPQNPTGLGRNTLEPTGIIDNIRIVSLIPPLAFQGGMQIATSRLLGFNELPVNVLTSTYADLMGDLRLFAFNNVRRNRRAASVILLLLGAIVSAWLMRSAGGLMSVLWLSGGIKFFTALGVFLFMPVLEDELPQ